MLEQEMNETTRDWGRETCWNCYRASTICLCGEIRPFEVEPLIGLLIHPKEFRKTVGTARIVKLSIRNSRYWIGYGADFDQNVSLLSILEDPFYFPMVLYPGPESLNLSSTSAEDLQIKIPSGRRLVILVIDGTWANARKMIRSSRVLSNLPRLSFEVADPSHYEFRKQPQVFCLSTVEAVVTLIQNMSVKGLCTPPIENAHYQMLKVFKTLVETQVNRDQDFRSQSREATTLRISRKK